MSDFETLSSYLTADKIMVYGVLVADLHPADFYVPDGKEFPSLTDIAFHPDLWKSRLIMKDMNVLPGRTISWTSSLSTE